MGHWINRWMIAALVMMTGTACMKLGTTASTDTQYYLLESVQTENASPLAALPPGSAIGIGPVTIPAYLDRPQMVTRLNGSQIRVDEFHRWAEPLQDAVLRALTENISAATGASRVVAFPWKRSLAVDLHVVVDVLRFDADVNGTVTLQARWQLLGEGGKKRLLERRASISRNSGGDYGQVASAMSDVLFDLSRDVSLAIADAVSQ